MVAANPNYRFPSAAPNAGLPVNRLAERVRHYFARRPEVSREEFLLEAVRKEIHFREQPEVQGTSLWSASRPPLTAEDIRIHALLIERLAVLDHERHGLWPRLRRFLFGNRLVRGLGLPFAPTGDR